MNTRRWVELGILGGVTAIVTNALQKYLTGR